ILLGIGSISLIVAGISILNVMLMSTVERKEEIGVLRAVGGRKRDIMKMILVEATLLGVGGGLFGVILSVGIGLAFHHFLFNDIMMTFKPGNLVMFGIAFGFGVTASLLSGLYPAWKAARQRPVETLRS
ncbi:MAG: FtsX-like permease family protein, partial [Halobacteria archaeon]|nr:FtsX-like permease family protein [Halobacteria archaeon]